MHSSALLCEEICQSYKMCVQMGIDKGFHTMGIECFKARREQQLI